MRTTRFFLIASLSTLALVAACSDDSPGANPNPSPNPTGDAGAADTGTTNTGTSGGTSSGGDSGGNEKPPAKADFGKLAWSLDLAQTGGATITVDTIRSGSDGSLFAAGYFEGSVKLGTATLDSLDEAGFIAKLGPDGTVAWLKKITATGDGGFANVEDIAVDDAGDVIALGRCSAVCVLDAVTATTGDIVFKLGGADGKAAWATSVKSTIASEPTSEGFVSLAHVAARGTTIAIAGAFDNVLEIPGATPVKLTGSTDTSDQYVATLGADGKALNAAALAGPGINTILDSVNALALDANGDVTILVQYTKQTLKGPGIDLTQEGFADGDNDPADVFLAKLASDLKTARWVDSSPRVLSAKGQPFLTFDPDGTGGGWLGGVRKRATTIGGATLPEVPASAADLVQIGADGKGGKTVSFGGDKDTTFEWAAGDGKGGIVLAGSVLDGTTIEGTAIPAAPQDGVVSFLWYQPSGGTAQVVPLTAKPMGSGTGSVSFKLLAMSATRIHFLVNARGMVDVAGKAVASEGNTAFLGAFGR